MNIVVKSLLTTTAAIGLLGAAAAPAFAHDAGSSGRPGVSSSGSCSAVGTWNLKAKTDDGALEVEFEVDTNVKGQTFAVRITDGATVVFDGPATTKGRSGSFSVERNTPDQAGKDTIKAVAVNGDNTCSGKVKI